LEQVLVEATTEGAQAMFVLQALNADPRQLAKLALQYRLPLLGQLRTWPDAGGLASYGRNDAYATRRAGYFVDLILKGVNPSDIPVESPNEYEFVLNLKTAKALGLTVPQSVRFQATDLLE
jgi:putative ABC transport system substrate-binding protein